ncbi:RNA-guided endonuclease InsQ/TnpB family protein [Anabaena catenula]|uniref:IS200/IS605 family element transposase accessory protein TnpB n=1 Tax=Anabaena catenula FACHB-362 TaxID=2692877 RepID=A0ABR8IYF4_9NOST|nr:RNA-guided endonuclease TnpB family protein [Anabaena catenula]MBD2690267.1 IS200/IS605 family element transposase accessory protein TnpB [Anabaena catenula FACHB-362]
MYGCQQIRINPSSPQKGVLEFLCSESVKLANCGTYYARQLFLKTGKIPGKFDLHRELGNNPHFSSMYSQAAQQCLTTVAESFKSYIGLLKSFKKGTLTQKPKLPGYRKGGFNLVTFPGQAVKLKDGNLRFPLGSKVKVWFGIDAFYILMPSNLEHKNIQEYRILPRNNQFYLELVYKISPIKADLNIDNVLSIDHGLNNWLTCISNVGTSFLIDGRKLKSMNQWYNKRVSVLKENQPPGFWSKQLASITEKRNRQIRDAINKSARIVINHCLGNKIGTIVFGWNTGQKDTINLGSKTNQKFVQIPTARLKDRIAQLCEQYSIKFVETEESYTSKASFLDNDILPKYGEKPDWWKESGKRVSRGLYHSQDGTKINADCNGAANIFRKVAVKLGLNLSGISRGVLISPLRLFIWS